ncbi:MAG: hypothetical protein K2K97_11890, partial [Muribaculaceae bacterium]|nr:hypothetical protein [Muribaculaceae bacterium]
YLEAREGEQSDYPGRHRPFDHIKGRAAGRYQGLRMMAEILCTTDDFLLNDEMEELLIKKADELHIRYRRNNQRGFEKVSREHFSKTDFKHLYDILSHLINVEYTGGKRVKYKRNVFDVIRKDTYAQDSKYTTGARRYKHFLKGRRLSAFTVDISYSEGRAIRKEVAQIRVNFFNDDKDSFAERFPLISMLGYMDDLAFDEDAEKKLNDISCTDMLTINYLPPIEPKLKRKIETVLSLGVKIAIRVKGENELLTPICIKEDGRDWVLIAKTQENPELRLLTPETLNSIFIAESDRHEESDNIVLKIDHIIGVSPLISHRPYDIKLELTEKGAEDITKPDSPFYPLNPEILSPENSNYGSNKKDRRKIASFAAFLNEDFLNELFQLDKNNKLVIIDPPEVNLIYDRYFESRMHKPRPPFEERKGPLREPKSTKV